ncbi:hypothetical protein BH11ACT2_BH11ACT2_20670 [soil metagenome]
MKPSVILSPEVVPVLSRGRHRSARQGACFMEFASFLAGEKWSDHPACTDPSLAHLARGVNDLVGDGARTRLTVLIPSVIGLTDPRDRMHLIVAARAGAAALPIANETRQRTIAVALQHLLAVLTIRDAGLADSLGRGIRSALLAAPAADAWARSFRAGVGTRATGDLAAITRTLTSVALVGIADACVDDADAVLVSLLERTIAECAAMAGARAISRTADPAFATA